MTRTSLVLALSLTVNAAFVAALVRTPDQAPEQAEHSPAQNPLPERSAAHASTGLSQPALWSRLESDDVDELDRRLHAGGFPPRVRRAILLDWLAQKDAAARAEIYGPREDRPYWKPTSYGPPVDPEKQAKYAAWVRQSAQEFRKYYHTPEALAYDEELAAMARGRFGDLPFEKLQHLTKIDADYEELKNRIILDREAGRTRTLTAGDREQLALLEAEKRRDLQHALTPEEFLAYELRSSDTAEMLRSRLELFRPSEAEYKALFALIRPLDIELGGTPWARAEGAHKRYAAALDTLKPQIEAALGPDRYADYLQAMTSGTDTLSRLVVRLDLPLATVGKVNAVRDEITKRANAIRNDAQLSAADRDAHLGALAQEAQAKLTDTLGGTRGYTAYEDLNGDWLRALRPKSPGP